MSKLDEEVAWFRSFPYFHQNQSATELLEQKEARIVELEQLNTQLQHQLWLEQELSSRSKPMSETFKDKWLELASEIQKTFGDSKRTNKESEKTNKSDDDDDGGGDNDNDIVPSPFLTQPDSLSLTQLNSSVKTGTKSESNSQSQGQSQGQGQGRRSVRLCALAVDRTNFRHQGLFKIRNYRTIQKMVEYFITIRIKLVNI